MSNVDGNPAAGVQIDTSLAANVTGSGLDNSQFSNVVRDVLGNKIVMTPMMGNTAIYETNGHATTGIPYALHGNAQVVSHDIGVHLAAFEDPIKAALGVRVVDTKKVIVKQRMVVGGGAQITPERSSAKTIGIKESVHEVELQRYGADLQMNLNLLNTPSLFKNELDMKLAAQKRYLENVLVELGYEALFDQGTNLVEAINRAHGGDPSDAAAYTREAEQVYMASIFGAMSKFSFPLQNLLSAAKHANLYTQSRGDSYSVLICPVPMLDIERYTKQDRIVYNVSGLSADQQKVEMPISNGVVTDPVTSIRILTHVPPARPDEYGSAYPSASEGGLSRQVTFANWYKAQNGNSGNRVYISDFKERSKHLATITTPGNGAPGLTSTFFVRIMSAQMASAVLVTDPGPNTGELLMAFPHTGVSTNQNTEELKMQLRAYMGAAIYRRNNVLVIPDVHFERLAEGHGCRDDDLFELTCAGVPGAAGNAAGNAAAGYARVTGRLDMSLVLSAADYTAISTVGNALYDQERAQNAQREGIIVEPGPAYNAMKTRLDSRKIRAYQGATWDGAAPQTQVTENAGHLGKLDYPTCPRLHGYHVFDSEPRAV